MHQPRRISSSGFSLPELMVAMLVTVILSAAIYGLMTGGQTAFRREPLLVERQQNIRIATDVIVRDIQNAGLGMTAGTQVFTQNLDSWAAAGSPVSPLTTPQRTYLGLGGVAGVARADSLQVLANDASCPTLTVCDSSGGNIFTNEPLPACLNPTATRGALVYVSGPNGPAVSDGPDGVLMLFPRGGGGGCGSGHLNAPNGQAPTLNPNGNTACANGTNGRCSFVALLQLVRYQIAPENPAAAVDPVRNPYSLWRSDSGVVNYDGSAASNPPGPGGANNPWRLIARGIEDLQVQYQTGAEWPAAPNTWLDTSPAVTADPTTIVQRVRITLSGYAIGRDVGGETQGGVAGPAGRGRRGQLTTIVTPRSALQVVQAANLWR